MTSVFLAGNYPADDDNFPVFWSSDRTICEIVGSGNSKASRCLDTK